MITIITLEQEDKDRIYNEMSNRLANMTKEKCDERIAKLTQRLNGDVSPRRKAVITERKRLIQAKRNTL